MVRGKIHYNEALILVFSGDRHVCGIFQFISMTRFTGLISSIIWKCSILMGTGYCKNTWKCRLIIQQWRLTSYNFATHPDINLKNQLQITLTKRITKFILSHTDTIFGSNQKCPRLMPKLVGCNSITQINLPLDIAQSICVWFNVIQKHSLDTW